MIYLKQLQVEAAVSKAALELHRARIASIARTEACLTPNAVSGGGALPQKSCTLPLVIFRSAGSVLSLKSWRKLMSKRASAVAGLAVILTTLCATTANAQEKPSVEQSSPAAPQPQPSATSGGVPQPASTGVSPPVVRPSTSPSGGSFSANSSKYGTSFTNSLKYSAGLRLQSQDRQLIKPNFDDGDRNFSKNSLAFDRFDLLSELDLQNKYFGVRLSGEGWYDYAYQGYNANNSPQTINQLTPRYNLFTPQTKNIQGQFAQLLDAFAFGNFNLGHTRVTLRAGQHALQWGQTLFLGANGMAGTMAPVDITKLEQEPDLQFKEIILPALQVSGEIQFSPEVTLGFYDQFHYLQDRLTPVGSYFSANDSQGLGAQRLFIGGPLYSGGPLASLGYGPQVTPANNTFQGGVELLLAPKNLGFEFGLYATQFAEKAPGDVVFNFGAGAGGFPGQIGQFFYTYPKEVHAYGLSLSKTIGDFNIAFEASYRTNSDLNGGQVTCGVVAPKAPPISCGDNYRNPGYPVGSLLLANGNFIWTLPPSRFAKESTLAFEVAYNDLLSVSANRALLNPFSTRSAIAQRFVFTPVYRQVFPDVDLSVPIGAGFGLAGYSSAPYGTLQAGGVGDYEIGLSASVHQSYTFTLGYTGYLGPSGVNLNTIAFPGGVTNGYLTGQQSLKDRNFLSFSVSRSF